MAKAFALPPTITEADAMIAQLTADIQSINDQLAAADLRRQIDRSSFSPQWAIRARGARTAKSQELNALRLHRNALKAARPRPVRDFRDILLDVVKETTPVEAWEGIVDEARRRMLILAPA